MSFTMSENWDSVTPPALPANWNNDAGMVTSSSQHYSGSNSLALTSGTAGVKYYATYGVSDPGAGATFDFTQLVYIDSSAPSGDYLVGPTFRCSAATMNNSSTSCYWLYLIKTVGLGSHDFRFAKIVNGTVTDLYTVFIGSGEVVVATWFAIRVITYGSNVFNVIVTRVSDGYTMDQFGAFNPTASVAISGFNATGVASGNYYGLCAAAANTGGKIFMDDGLVNASGGSVVLPPKRPLVVPVAFQYNRPD
jgi:hypothetical protein